jgi:uncharacterized membrane protein
VDIVRLSAMLIVAAATFVTSSSSHAQLLLKTTIRRDPPIPPMPIYTPIIYPSSAPSPYVPTPPHAIPAQPAQAARAVFLHSLSICNHYTDLVSVAISYQSGGGYISTGWWKLAEGGCTPTFRPAYDMQYYAYSADGKSWSGSQPHCVTIAADFNIKSSGSDQSCPDGEQIRSFTIVDNSQGEAYSTNLVAN